jgi:hypothetical protein
MGSHKLPFDQSDLEPQSSQSQPPAYLGWQMDPVTGWHEVSWIFCLGWPPTTILLISASQETRIPSMSHWCPACKVFFFFFWQWTQGIALARQVFNHLSHTSNPANIFYVRELTG